MNYDGGRALALLRIGSGQPGALFRDRQQEAIRHLVEGARLAPRRAEDGLGQALSVPHRCSATAPAILYGCGANDGLAAEELAALDAAIEWSVADEAAWSRTR